MADREVVHLRCVYTPTPVANQHSTAAAIGCRGTERRGEELIAVTLSFFFRFEMRKVLLLICETGDGRKREEMRY